MVETDIVIGVEYRHKNNGKIYIIKDIISSEHPDTGEWYVAVLYYAITDNRVSYSRKMSRFVNSFELI